MASATVLRRLRQTGDKLGAGYKVLQVMGSNDGPSPLSAVSGWLQHLKGGLRPSGRDPQSK